MNTTLREVPLSRYLRACYQRAVTIMEHVLRKPVESRRAYTQRRRTLAFATALALAMAAALAILLAG